MIRIFGNIPSLAWTALPEGCADLINQRWREHAEPFEGVAAHKEWKKAMHGDDLRRVLSGWRGLKTIGEAGSVEVRARHGHGGYRGLLMHLKPLADGARQIVRRYGLGTDIGNRKHHDDMVRAVERGLSSIIDTIPALVWSSRVDGSVEFFNQHYLDFVGLSAERACGWGWIDAIHPGDVLDLLASWRTIMASQVAGETEGRVRRFDGEYRWILFRLNPLKSECGRIIRWYGISIDIDDRKRVEARLRRSETFLAEGQRASATGSFSWCMSTGEIIFSEELRRIFAFDPSDVVTPERIANRVYPDDAAPFAEKMEAVQLDGADLDCEIRLLMPEGAIKYVRVVSHGSQGKSDRREIVGAVQDVTQRRVTDEALGNLQAELARMSKINSLGALTASIAHEVNQPLAGIITNASTCLHMLSADPPNVQGAVETARRTIRDGHRASNVIARVRAIFSKKASATDLVNLNEAIREVIALSQSTLKNNRVILRMEFTDPLPPVRGDRVQLQQVILNLLLNAAEAMGSVDDRPRQMLIRTERHADCQVHVVVRDSGVGFEPGGAARMFDTFYTTKEGGMGIGLAISKSIIERHRGRFGAAANEGHGATFWFSIPHELIPGMPGAH
jgi:PAS domain S-box-containing protein